MEPIIWLHCIAHRIKNGSCHLFSILWYRLKYTQGGPSGRGILFVDIKVPPQYKLLIQTGDMKRRPGNGIEGTIKF